MDKRQLSMDKETKKIAKVAKSRADVNLAQETKSLPTFHINLWISGNCKCAKRTGIGDGQRDTKSDVIRETGLCCEICIGKKRHVIINLENQTRFYCGICIGKRDSALNMT